MLFFRTIIFIFCAVVVSANQLDAQVNPNKVPFDFKKAKVITDSLINYGFGRDAFDHLEEVFGYAIEEKNVSEVYQILNLYPDVVGQSMMEVDEKHTILSKFELLATTTEAPISNLIHAFLAQQLSEGYQWELNNWENDFVVECWMNGKQVYFTTKNTELNNEIIAYHHQQSFENPEVLQQFPMGLFFKDADNDYLFAKINGTLFDILGDQLINHIQIFETFTDNYNFNELDSNWFDKTESYLKLKSTSVLKMYQQLEMVHLKNKNYEAYTYWYLQRLEFVYNQFYFDEKRNDKMLKGLARLQLQIQKHPSSLGVTLREARLIQNQSTYNWSSNPKAKDQLYLLHQVLVNAAKTFPTSIYVKSAQLLIADIESKEMNVHFKSKNLVGKANLLNVNYKNITEGYLHIYHIDKNPENLFTNNPMKGHKLTIFYEKALKFDQNGLYNMHSKDFLIPTWKKSGEYLLIISSTKDSANVILNLDSIQANINFAYSIFNVAGMEVISNNRNGSFQIFALNPLSGKPINGAEIYQTNRSNSEKTLIGKTNSDGKFQRQVVTESLDWQIKYKNDSISNYAYNGRYNNHNENVKYKVFTDRNIYRPGQTVYYKIIAYKGKSPDFKVVDDFSLDLKLQDENSTDLAEATGITNDFGSFSGSLILPKSGFMLGSIYLTINGFNHHYLQVEEYKRPSFEVEADFEKKEYKMGDNVKVKGTITAFAGYGMANTSLHVKVNVYDPYFFDYNYNSEDFNLILDTVFQTDTRGNFEFNFLAKNDKSLIFGSNFSYTIDATSLSGETQQASNSIFIGQEKTDITVDFPTQVVEGEKSFGVIYLSDKSDAKIQVNLYREKDDAYWKEEILDESQFKDFDHKKFKTLFPNAHYGILPEDSLNYSLIKSFHVSSWDSLEISNLVGKLAGNFKVEAKFLDIDKNWTSSIHFFNFIRLDSPKGQHKQPLWVATSKKIAQPGDEVNVLVGSRFKKSQVLFEIYRGDSLLKQEWISLKSRKIIPYHIVNADLGGLSFHVLTFVNGQYYNTSASLNIPFNSKKLDVKLETMREVLQPGIKDKWKMSVTLPNGNPAFAELLVGMTDISLDQFVSSDWNYSFYENNYTYNTWQNPNNGTAYFAVHGSWNFYKDYYSYKNNSEVRLMEGQTLGALTGYAETGSFNTYMFTTAVNGNSISVVTDAIENEIGEDIPTEVPKDISIAKQDKTRTNFSETAFFYPSISTINDKEFKLEFTLPDALTAWKFQAFAHSKEMKTGYFTKNFIAKKDLMIDPNEPRFFRAGDEFVFVANVVNLTDNVQNVTVTLEWFNPMTNEVLKDVMGILQPQTLAVDPKGMTIVSWNLKVPSDGIDLIAYRIKANSTTFSDGEEKVIPILSNRMQVIESLPLSLDKVGNYNFELTKLKQSNSPTFKASKLVLEYNSNPIWSVVMSIPYLTDYPYDCAEQTFSKFLANVLSHEIIKRNPQIRTYLKDQNIYTPDLFLSQLEKNEDLKAVILAETPWVLDAKNETEQRQRIVQLLDENVIFQQNETLMNKLMSMQNPDGGWSWFEGGKSNQYITQHIAMGIGKIQSANLEGAEYVDMTKTINFLRKLVEAKFNSLTKVQKANFEGLGSLEVQWLNLQSYYGVEESAVSNYFTECLKKQWTKFPLQIQAIAGNYFLLINEDKLSSNVLMSIQNRATTKPNLGTYWNENRNAYSWDKNSIETQVALIDFFQNMGMDESVVGPMKLWLLNQKQGQSWESTKTTAMACFALLVNSEPTFLGTIPTNIKVGNQLISIDDANAPIGYFKETWNKSQINPALGKITISNTSDNPAFGSLTLVYSDEMENIAKNESGLKLTKELYVIQSNQEVKITPNTILKVGDQVRVRLQVVCDRDLEFVHLKDLRASGTENIDRISGNKTVGNLTFYQVNQDASTGFFIDYLPKGKHNLSYDLFVTSAGVQSVGFAQVECLYAPSFRANSISTKITVK